MFHLLAIFVFICLALAAFVLSGFFFGSSQVHLNEVKSKKDWPLMLIIWPGLVIAAFVFAGFLVAFLFPFYTVILWLMIWSAGLTAEEDLIKTFLSWAQWPGDWVMLATLALLATFLGSMWGLAHEWKKVKIKGTLSKSAKEPLRDRLIRVIPYIAIGVLFLVLGIYLPSDLFYPVVAGAGGIGGDLWVYFDAKRTHNSPRMAMLWAIAFFFAFPLSFCLYDVIRPQPRGAI